MQKGFFLLLGTARGLLSDWLRLLRLNHFHLLHGLRGRLFKWLELFLFLQDLSLHFAILSELSRIVKLLAFLLHFVDLGFGCLKSFNFGGDDGLGLLGLLYLLVHCNNLLDI
jgi:hypothetical protein